MPLSAEIQERAIGIAGAGPVAQAFGRALIECGVDISYVASRDLSHAEAAARSLASHVRAVGYGDLAECATHVIIAVSDRAITPVAEELARANKKLRVVLHTCGSYGPEALVPLNAAGVSCGSLHPLQTIRDAKSGANGLQGAAFAVSGDSEALRWAEEIATVLSGTVLCIHPDGRHFYHAAAVMASNYIAALLDSTEHLMTMAGVPKSDALPAIAPLARAALENVLQNGPVEALTGPIVRGDAATVAAHAQALQSADASIASLYRAAGLRALRMAVARGLREEQAESVRQALTGRR
jgi:predicted short-subunit dehydrogenase-like oxidoreductase (DUF2520 family)